MLHDREIGVLHVKNKLFIFLTQLFLLSSRLFAVAYFIVSYKWWIVALLMLHSLIMLAADIILYCKREKAVTPEIAVVALFLSLLNWLRDDLTLYLYFDDEGQDDDNRKQGKRMQLFSDVLFVAENSVMISLFYFSDHSKTWYALPITVCVCSLSYVGALMRLIHFRFLRKWYVNLEPDESPDQELISVTSPTVTASFTAFPEQNRLMLMYESTAPWLKLQVTFTLGAFFWGYSGYSYSGLGIEYTEFQFRKERSYMFRIWNKIGGDLRTTVSAHATGAGGRVGFPAKNFPKERVFCLFRVNRIPSILFSLLSGAEWTDIPKTEYLPKEHKYRLFRVFLFRNSPKRTSLY